MNIKGKYGIPNLSDLSKISHENEILCQSGGVGVYWTPLNPSLEPDQAPQNALCDQDLHLLPLTQR